MNWRLLFGFTVAPILPCTLAVLPGIIAHPEWTGGWRLIGLMVVVSLLVSWVVAMPAYFFLRHRWGVRLIQCLLAGAVIGALVTCLPLLLTLGGNFSASDSGGPTVINGYYTIHGWLQNSIAVFQSAFLGSTIGLMFWLVAIWSPSKSGGNEA